MEEPLKRGKIIRKRVKRNIDVQKVKSFNALFKDLKLAF